MAIPFPTLSAGSLQYPIVRSQRFVTGVLPFINGAEQRVPDMDQYAAFSLSLTNLDGYDRSLIEQFVHDVKGSYDNTVSLTVDGVTYNNLYLIDDTLTFVDIPGENFSTTIRFSEATI